MKREGKTLKKLASGDARRMSDGKNAWRKMTDHQRREFLRWIGEERPEREQRLVVDAGRQLAPLVRR